MATGVDEAEAGVVDGAALEHDQRVTVGIDARRDVPYERRADPLPVQVGRDGERRQAEDRPQLAARTTEVDVADHDVTGDMPVDLGDERVLRVVVR